MAKILTFAGSLRKDSLNKRLISLVTDVLRGEGLEVTLLDLRDLPMPIYDGDIESDLGLPENAKKFKTMLIEHDAVIISTPEYNSEIPAVLKNAIDWASRPEPEDVVRLQAFAGKVAGVMSAAPGLLGGARVRMSLRALLSYLGMFLVPEQFGLSGAREAFDKAGGLKDKDQEKILMGMIRSTLNLVSRIQD